MISASTIGSAKNQKWWMEKKTVPAPTIEPTCAAFGTTKKQPHTSNVGKAKERNSCPWWQHGGGGGQLGGGCGSLAEA